MDVQKVLHLPDGEFMPALEQLDMEDIVNLIQELQEEMTDEQSKFNTLKIQLQQCDDPESQEGKKLTEAMVESQEKLKQLMQRTRQCFNQQTSAQESKLFTAKVTNIHLTENSSNDVKIEHNHVKATEQSNENNNIDSIQSYEVSAASQQHNGILKKGTPKRLNKTGDLQFNNMEHKEQSNTVNTDNNLSAMIAPSNDSNTELTHSSYHTSTTVNLVNVTPNFNSNLQMSNMDEKKQTDKIHDNHLVNDNTQNLSGSDPVNINPSTTVTKHKLFSIRSMNERSNEQQKPLISSQSDENEESVLSVSAARSLFEGNSKTQQGPIKVKRNFSVGAKDHDKQLQKISQSSTTVLPPKDNQPYKSASMHNLNKPNENNEVKFQPENKSANRIQTLSSSNVSKVSVIKSNTGPVKPMGRAPVVRTAWSQKPVNTVEKPNKQFSDSSKQKEIPPWKKNLNTQKTKEIAIEHKSKPVFTSPVTVQSAFQLPELRSSNTQGSRTADQSISVNLLPVNKSLPDDRVPPALTSPMTKDSEGFFAEDNVQDRVTLKNWDPTPLLEDLYEIQLNEDESNDDYSYINTEGYMEKLPMNKKKATLLKTWKKRYFKARDGNLYYYEVEDLNKATGCLPLGGGNIEDLGEHMLGIDDGRGRYLVVKCANDEDFNNWNTSLNSQVTSNMTSRWVKPLHSIPPHTDKKVIVMDLGSCSVRAGILGNKPALPELFFPTVVGINNETQQEYVGFECAKPEIRSKCKFIFPVRPTVKIDKFSLNMEVMPAIFQHVFKNLKVNPKEYWIMFSSPANFSDKIKEDFMNILIKMFGVQGVNIVNQTLLALYSYNAMSGIVVDIGERLEIVPVTDGYIVEQGVSRQPYGGHRITQALNSFFTEKRYRFFTDVEFQIVRLALEKTCFVSQNYASELTECNAQPNKFRKSINLEKYNLPKGSWTEVSNDLGRFKGPEGLFNLEVWGMDNPPLQKLIQNAVQASPMDTRREMWRSIYLSGGVTMLPGFVSRLETELNKLAPPSVTVQIHSSPHRYHSAYLGASALANMGVYEQSCISAKEWLNVGPPVLRKWHMY